MATKPNHARDFKEEKAIRDAASKMDDTASHCSRVDTKELT